MKQIWLFSVLTLGMMLVLSACGTTPKTALTAQATPTVSLSKSLLIASPTTSTYGTDSATISYTKPNSNCGGPGYKLTGKPASVFTNIVNGVGYSTLYVGKYYTAGSGTPTTSTVTLTATWAKTYLGTSSVVQCPGGTASTTFQIRVN
jgi:hypothetical protein